jgi:hypothetical protein
MERETRQAPGGLIVDLYGFYFIALMQEYLMMYLFSGAFKRENTNGECADWQPLTTHLRRAKSNQ